MTSSEDDGEPETFHSVDRNGVLADGTKAKTRPAGVFRGNRYEFEGREWITPEAKVVVKIGPGYFEWVEQPK